MRGRARFTRAMRGRARFTRAAECITPWTVPGGHHVNCCIPVSLQLCRRPPRGLALSFTHKSCMTNRLGVGMNIELSTSTIEPRTERRPVTERLSDRFANEILASELRRWTFDVQRSTLKCCLLFAQDDLGLEGRPCATGGGILAPAARGGREPPPCVAEALRIPRLCA
jgi:hypothetical protein